jgi:hypothetical protein
MIIRVAERSVASRNFFYRWMFTSVRT